MYQHAHVDRGLAAIAGCGMCCVSARVMIWSVMIPSVLPQFLMSLRRLAHGRRQFSRHSCRPTSKRPPAADIMGLGGGVSKRKKRKGHWKKIHGEVSQSDMRKAPRTEAQSKRSVCTNDVSRFTEDVCFLFFGCSSLLWLLECPHTQKSSSCRRRRLDLGEL